MTEKRRTPVRLAPLGAALALVAVLILSGVVILTAACVPTRASHTPTAEPTARPAATSTATPETDDTTAEAGASAGSEQLTIREWPVAAADVMGPGRFEYNDLLGDEILARIQSLRDRSAARSLAQYNEDLAPFGYRLESRFDDQWHKTLYDLYREGESEPLLAGLVSILRVSVNASGTEFVLAAENAPGARPMYVLVRNGQVESLDLGQSGLLAPAYVGDALAQITFTGLTTMTYQVELDAQAVPISTTVIYTGTAVGVGAYMPLRSFTTWDEHWVLGVDDHLIMDGEDMGQALGYDATFGFARIGAQPFYFFEQDGVVRISYGGQVLPNTYETVFHNHCCEASIHNVEAGPDAVWFHALRDGTWYFVEASLDE